MKYILFAALFITLFFSYDFAFTQTEPTKPWVPYGQQVVTNGSITAAMAMQTPKSQTAAIPLLHFSTSQPAHALNHLKGEFGEQVMDSLFTNRMLKSTGGWSAATPFHRGRTGIDGLYFKMDKNGIPHDMLVSDAKYGSARLGITASGKQMSETWIKPRLQDTSRMYRALAADMENANISLSEGIAKNSATSRINIPLNDQTDIAIWRTKDGIHYFCPDKSVSPADVQKQLTRAATYIEGAADGKIGYRSRLFTYKPNGNEHVFRISSLDKNGNVISSQTVKNTFSELPVEYQKTIKSIARRTLLSWGKSRTEVKELVSRCCDNPEMFNQICLSRRSHYFAGLDHGAFKMAGVVGAAVMGIDTISQYLENGKIDAKRMVIMGGLSGGAAVAGNYAGTQTSILLSQYNSILGKLAGPAVGGSLASVVISYGLYGIGYTDLRTSNRSALTGVGISVAGTTVYYATSYGILTFATTFGTASTGTAISSLSGAAATKAGLAWLGGGSLTAGGGGVAAGSVIVTGGAIIAVIVVSVAVERGIHYAFYLKDERDKQRYLNEIVRLTEKRVKEGKQLEWTN